MAEPQAAVATLPTRDRSTLRGPTSGVVTVEDTGLRGSVILVGDQSCSWLPHLGFLELNLVGVLLQSDKLLDLVEDKVVGTPAACKLGAGNRLK